MFLAFWAVASSGLGVARAQSGGPAAPLAPHPLSMAEKARVDEIIRKMSTEEKLAYIGGTGFAVRAMTALHLPAWEMSDGPYGVRSNAGLPSTTYASGIGLAASWDRALAFKVGESLGRDGRARGVHYQLGPGTNIYRSPRNGRNFEYFGEDPYLAGQMVTAYITGVQSEGVSATVKHFVANNSEFLRHDSDSVVDERTLREIYFPAFEAAVKQGHTGAVMDSYNLINGKHATESVFDNMDVLRKEWGFQGTLMSDWDATYDAVGAANGGLDLEMPTGKFMNPQNLLPAMQAGTVSQATIDEKVRHILTTAAMFGWLDREQRDPSISMYDAEANQTALQSAREAAVLLKNDGNLLPFRKTGIKTVLVVGPEGYPGAPVGGGSAGVVPFHNISLLEGLSATLGSGVTVFYDEGLPSLRELANKTDFMTAENGGEHGLTVENYPNRELSGAPQQHTVAHLNQGGLGWGASGMLQDALGLTEAQRAHGFSQRYTGYFNARASGDYLVALAGEGEHNGNRVYLDGKLVIDNWRYLRAFEPHLTLPLTAGVHKVVVESWDENWIGGRLRLAILPEEQAVTQRAKQLAAKADAVIVAVGFQGRGDNNEGEGGDRTFDLPYGQDALIRAMAAANPNTAVTITSGGNVDSTSWIDKVPALVEGWYGGQAAGQAMAEILFGDYNPSGHLPATFERHAEDNPTFSNYYPQDGGTAVVYKEGIFVGYRGYEKNQVKPLFPFGYGLSYTTFTFANLKITKGSGGPLALAEFDVTNSGQRAGAEVAQVYVSDTHAKVPRPMHELKGFERVEIAPGETKHVSVPLGARAFAYWDVRAHRWTIDPGQFTVSVGDSVASLPLTGHVEIAGEAARGVQF